MILEQIENSQVVITLKFCKYCEKKHVIFIELFMKEVPIVCLKIEITLIKTCKNVCIILESVVNVYILKLPFCPRTVLKTVVLY
jgi:hypothetical protein